MSPLLVAPAVAAMVVAGTLLAWRAGGPAGRPLDPATPVRIVALGYLVLYGIGSVWLSLTGEATGGPLLVGAAFVALGVGTFLATRLMGRPDPVPEPTTIGTLRAWAAIGLALVGLLAFASLAREHGIPLLADDPQDSRSGWGGYVFDLCRWFVPPAALVALAVALATDRRSAWVAAAVSLAGVLGLEVLVASRALPFELGLAAIVMAWWAGRRLGVRSALLVLAAAGVIFLGVLFARISPGGGFSNPVDAIEFALERTINRVLLIHPRTIDLVVETFPDEEPYLGGDSYLRWLARFTGDEPGPPLGGWLFERLFPGEPPGGFAAPGVLAEGYANGGPFLALALMLALGIGATWLGRRQPRWQATAATRVLGALLVVALMRTYATSLNGLALTVAAAVVWWVGVGLPLDRIRRRRTRSAADPADPADPGTPNAARTG